jgi:hypothetical protein
MAFYMYAPGGPGVQRYPNGMINVILTKDNPAPPLPFELQSSIRPDTWAHRVDAITQCCYKYSSPIIERIWFGLAFTAMFIVPMVINQVVFRSLYEDIQTPDTLYRTRWILFGIFVGTALLLWVPLIAWKAFGRRQVKKLLDEWAKLDRSTAPNTFLPSWRVSTPGIFRSTAALSVTTPPIPVMTSFSANAPLPPYINAPGYQHPPMPPPLGYPVDEKTAFEDLDLKSGGRTEKQ